MNSYWRNNGWNRTLKKLQQIIIFGLIIMSQVFSAGVIIKVLPNNSDVANFLRGVWVCDAEEKSVDIRKNGTFVFYVLILRQKIKKCTGHSN